MAKIHAGERSKREIIKNSQWRKVKERNGKKSQWKKVNEGSGKSSQWRKIKERNGKKFTVEKSQIILIQGVPCIY